MRRGLVVRRVVCALALPLLSARQAAAQGAPPYRVSWWDAVSLGAAATLAAVPVAADLPKGPPPCAPCDPATLWSIDRAALHTFSDGAAKGSNALLAGVVALTAVGSMRGVPWTQARGNAAAIATGLGWTAAASEWLKVATHRSRPILYTAQAPAVASDPDSRRSLPSTHVALAFTAATSYFVIARREHLRHRTRNAILAYVGAVGVGVLRVVAGKHFPTDVAAAAALGSGVGWLAATVHPVAR